MLDFQKVQKLAVQKEAAYAMATRFCSAVNVSSLGVCTFDGNVIRVVSLCFLFDSLSSDEHKTHDTNEEHEQLLQEQKR